MILIFHCRFVHGDGCVTVTCVSVDNSTTVANQAKILVDDEGKQVFSHINPRYMSVTTLNILFRV